MKTLLNALIIVMLTVASSCTSDEPGPVGPMGPQGDQGPQGPKGDSGFVFEYENVNFTAPDYEVFLPFPSNFESLSSDVALVYFLWDVVQINGVATEVWRQIPQSILLEPGLLQYNFDFTVADVRLFLDATFDLSLLGAIDTDDWVVRVVIVPGDFWNSSRMAQGELPYEEVKEMLGLPDLPIPAVTWQRR
jgi:hypothetical protein